LSVRTAVLRTTVICWFVPTGMTMREDPSETLGVTVMRASEAAVAEYALTGGRDDQP
jgi:hypothetical protein